MKNSRSTLLLFDLDGTLYSFDADRKITFGSSKLYVEIKNNAYRFLQQRCGISLSDAITLYEDICRDFKGEVSLGIEARLKIDRYEFFRETWGIDPRKILPQQDLAPLFASLNAEIAILTAAPRVWADPVLDYLNLSRYKERLFTGEPNIRKPDADAFKNVCDVLRKNSRETISIGDQVATDILPAKSLGMQTILIGTYSPEADRCIDALEDLPKALEGLIQ